MTDLLRPCKTKVFLSCGQREGRERELAQLVKRHLESDALGFQVYVATEVQSIEAIEGILKELKSSEYFLFIDMKREVCEGDPIPISLFSHQELAVAKSWNLDSAFLRQKGVRPHGLAEYMFTNPREFSDTSDVIGAVDSIIEKAKWSSGWKNALYLGTTEPDRGVLTSSKYSGRDVKCRADFFHIRVTNMHKNVAARHAVAYLTRVAKKNGDALTGSWPNEHKWAGYLFPEAFIPPQRFRDFDAFYVIREAIPPQTATEPGVALKLSPQPHSNTFTSGTVEMYSTVRHQEVSVTADSVRAHFNTHTDYSGYQQPLASGEYELVYEVWADGFPKTVAQFDAHIAQTADDTTLTLIEQSHYYV